MPSVRTKVARASWKITEKRLKWYGYVMMTKEEHIKDACMRDMTTLQTGNVMVEEGSSVTRNRQPQITGQAREEDEANAVKR